MIRTSEDPSGQNFFFFLITEDRRRVTTDSGITGKTLTGIKASSFNILQPTSGLWTSNCSSILFSLEFHREKLKFWNFLTHAPTFCILFH